MKQLNIPFKLGMQYDNWEFDLEVAKDRVQGLTATFIWVRSLINF